ncbi:MAG: DUF3750 domain-containing protein [Rhodospirillaceae bacterium]|jgi:hypothetical protein|nr:DUF3750 domain-containing protein [Rhodospirillaceae bacterium]MBT4487896.1 DUF3750 domain-containing protein [Rhodospirillaceae bacterium]MBT5195634.1 DUF3750 domain-containing protein [Rhodospirillaceae bacterium]MBT5896413.1 DUF3750 domain-containing protein [Rhodospirillaceae bacterium]MBT6427410.1 DUF3750 domain-containing protein [Rhodospirillaceae bacterium]
MLTPTTRRRLYLILLLPVLIGLSLLMSLALRAADPARAADWQTARNDSSHQAPDPATTQEAVLQVYAARAFSWRGVFGVHTWFAVKPAGADHYLRLEVMGWGVRYGQPAVRISRYTPDAYWFGSRPRILLELRGARASRLIADVMRAAAQYPYPDSYRIWPGPNSNTFTAYLGRQVPELGLELPAIAIGKDYLTNGDFLANAPSGTGKQISLYGLAGLTVAVEEGVELNILGLTLGLDLFPPALKLPGIGRLGAGM